jgi:hypothetical protein
LALISRPNKTIKFHFLQIPHTKDFSPQLFPILTLIKEKKYLKVLAIVPGLKSNEPNHEGFLQGKLKLISLQLILVPPKK